MRTTSLLVVALASACTTLGPTPATTGISALPAGRPSGELQIGAMPGFHLSAGATPDHKGAALPQLAALFEPDRWIVPGLVLALRAVGNADAGVFVEPMVGYRRALNDRLALGAVIYGTHAEGSHQGASYSVERFGAELAGDVRATPINRWIELHITGAASLTGLFGDGVYCLDSQDRYGVDCSDAASMRTSLSASGFYPAGSAGLFLDFGRHLANPFGGVRIGIVGAVGTMPTYLGGVQASAESYASAGVSLSVGIGAEHANR